MSRETQTPQIPQVTEENLLEVVRSLKEIMEVREGRRGDELDELVTYRDLVSLGLVKKLSTGGYGDNTGTTDTPVVIPTDDSNVPPAPTDFTVKAVYNIVVLSWTVPSYRNHGVTEIWRAKADDLTKAAKIGDTAGTQFTDPPGDGGTYWYWVRNVSTAGVAGPYNSQAGTSATAMPSVYDILKDIAADIESSALMRDLRSRVEGLEDGTFVPKYINDVVIRADEIARESKTLVSRSNSSLAYVQQVMETVSGMRAKYTVKLGVGGHVAGFGMAVENNAAGTATSAFIVASDKFAVAPPSIVQTTAPVSNLYTGMVWVDSSVTPNVTKYYTGSGWSTSQAYASLPFVVYTSPTVVNGRTIQPGVYMKGAFIEELQVDKLTAGTVSVAISLTAAKLLGGQFTSYAWPTTAGGGYYIGSEGMLLGTYNVSIAATTMTAGRMYRILTVGTTDFTAVGAASNTAGVTFTATGAATGTGTVALESFFQVDAASGAVYAPGFSIVNGKMTVSQINVIDTGQIITGAVASPTGSEVSADTLVSTSALTAYMSTSINTEGRGLWVYCSFSVYGNGSLESSLIVNGTTVASRTFNPTGIIVTNHNTIDTGSSDGSYAVFTKFVASPGSGSLTVELKLRDASGVGIHIRAGSNMFVIGTKR